MSSRHASPLLKLAMPMVLSASTITIMQLIDALVLSRHSNEAVAAIGPAGMAVILFQGFLFGTASYCGTFVAHSHGRGDGAGVRRSVWLGIQTTLAAGLAALLCAWPLAQTFLHLGHAEAVAEGERAYFLICMLGAVFPVLGGALSGWLSGIGRPALVTWVSFITIALNGVLAWGLVLGQLGMPRLGMAGAALATVTAQAAAAVLYVLLFARAGGFTHASERRLDLPELKRFLSLALPMGLRISGELTCWTLFLIAIGRLGTVELAASSIAFRINGMAFFPAIGLGQAAGVLVGQARGAGRDEEVPAITRQALYLCGAWMFAMALLYVLAGRELTAAFTDASSEGLRIVDTGATIMRFIAAYCLVDALNIILGFCLAAAGDTRWIARTFLACSAAFLAGLWGVALFAPSLAAEWTLAVVFIASTGLLWGRRFCSGAWRSIRLLKDRPA